MSYTFNIPTKVLFGTGRLGELHNEKMPGKKALIVISCGRSTKANFYLDRFQSMQSLSSARQ